MVNENSIESLVCYSTKDLVWEVVWSPAWYKIQDSVRYLVWTSSGGLDDIYLIRDLVKDSVESSLRDSVSKLNNYE